MARSAWPRAERRSTPRCGRDARARRTAAGRRSRAGTPAWTIGTSAAWADMDGSRPVVEAVIPLVESDGTLVINRHRRGDAGALARMLRHRFASVRTQRVRREGENVLIYASRPGRR